MLGGAVLGRDRFERPAEAGDAPVDFVFGNRERRAEPDRPVAAAEDDGALLERVLPDRVAKVRRGEIERAHQSATTHVADGVKVALQLVEAVLQVRADGSGVVDKIVRLDDLEDAVEADHVDQVAAPRGVDPARRAEDVIVDLVQLLSGEDAADLRLLAERDDIRLDAERLVGPELAGDADAALHFVKDQERVVFVREVP